MGQNNPVTIQKKFKKKVYLNGGGGTLDWLPESQNVARLQCSVYFHQKWGGGGVCRQKCNLCFITSMNKLTDFDTVLGRHSSF